MKRSRAAAARFASSSFTLDLDEILELAEAIEVLVENWRRREQG